MVEYVDDEKFLDETPSDEELNAMQIRFNTRNIEAFVMGKRKDVDFKSVIFTFDFIIVLFFVLFYLFIIFCFLQIDDAVSPSSSPSLFVCVTKMKRKEKKNIKKNKENNNRQSRYFVFYSHYN